MSVILVAALKILQKLKENRTIDNYIMLRGKGFIGLRPLPFGLPPLRMRGMTNVSLIRRSAQNHTESKKIMQLIFTSDSGERLLV